MQKIHFGAIVFLLGALLIWDAAPASATAIHINARSAMLVDLTSGQVLYEQDVDTPIAPASITKVLSLYLLFEAIQSGKLHLWDNVKVSSRAARTGGSRMGLRTGDIVPVGELIKGMAVVSGNDACVAMAEHMSGSVEGFVCEMNRKARELGMNSSNFQTPNGLPANGQLTTARDIAKLSLAYLKRFPESLQIHSIKTYTYRTATHRNANRLLGTCPGVDGLKTGFVCASGYNFAATAIRGVHRLVAVVLGSPSPGVRAKEGARLLNEGYNALQTDTILVCAPRGSKLAGLGSSSSSSSLRRSSGPRGKSKHTNLALAPGTSRRKSTATASPKTNKQTIGSASDQPARSSTKSTIKVTSAEKNRSSKTNSTVKEASAQKAPSPGAVAAPPQHSQKPKAGRGSAATRVVSSGSGKAQGNAKGSATATASGSVKPSKISAGNKTVREKTVVTQKNTTNTKPDKTTSTESQKTCPPTPAVRKTNTNQKSS